MTNADDVELFSQPDGTHLGECPICFLPMPLDVRKYTFKACCSKKICDGCVVANVKSNGSSKCPFCREPADGEEWEKRMMKRIKANDPAALCQMGVDHRNEGDHGKAFEYWEKAAELGDPEAHNMMSIAYHEGEGVVKDEEKAVYHLEKAAIGGHYLARHNLGSTEAANGRMDRAVKHFIIAANLGHEDSMKELWKYYSAGRITKQDLDATLRSHQSAIDATKSLQREEAEATYQQMAASRRYKLRHKLRHKYLKR